MLGDVEQRRRYQGNDVGESRAVARFRAAMKGVKTACFDLNLAEASPGIDVGGV